GRFRHLPSRWRVGHLASARGRIPGPVRQLLPAPQPALDRLRRGRRRYHGRTYRHARSGAQAVSQQRGFRLPARLQERDLPDPPSAWPDAADPAAPPAVARGSHGQPADEDLTISLAPAAMVPVSYPG